MRNLYYILFAFILAVPLSTEGKNLQVFFQSAVFNVPSQEPFVETYLTVLGNSATFKKTATGKFQSSILITMLFSQNGEIKAFRKYNLSSPEVNDSIGPFPNFVDQQRVSLANGHYDFELFVADNNFPADSFSYKSKIVVDIPANDICISGIEMLEKYEMSKTQTIITKNGFDLYPYVSDFYPENINKIGFYAEIYNTDKALKDEDFIIRYTIATVSQNYALSKYSKFKKLKPAPVHVLLAEFDIDSLPSGNYNLAIEVVSKNNKVLKHKKVFFQRSKNLKQNTEIDYKRVDVASSFVSSITNLDTLREYIRSTWPISGETEKRYQENILKSDTLKYLQQYFYGFWQSRSFTNPQGEWESYDKQVKLVNRLYKTPVEKGYASERGRVYLQYGAPNSITENKFDAIGYPNEIWHYYSVKGQSNIKFVFYNPDLTANTYRLLHSDLRGEIQNPKWENVIYSRHEGKGISTEGMQGNEHFSGKTKSTGTVDGRMK